MAWLRAGTVAVTNGSTTVTGTATGFAANTRVGDAFIGPDGRQYELVNVASDTVISITPAYQGVTASGASYAVMPVQGYQKGLADQVRDWVNTYGQKMAALGTTGNYDILPLAKGGTGNTTGTATKLAAAAMVGTVSQSGGVPTGAILERGTNAQGNYIKYADGTLHCWTRMSTTAVSNANGSIFNSAAIYPGNFPAAFVSLPVVIATATAVAFSWAGNYVEHTQSAWGGWVAFSPVATGGFAWINLFATGRWY